MSNENENVQEELLEEQQPEANHAESMPEGNIEEKSATELLDDIAYFVIFPQNTKVLDEAIAIIPNEVAKKAVLDAINSVLIPVTKQQLEEAQATQAEPEETALK